MKYRPPTLSRVELDNVGARLRRAKPYRVEGNQVYIK